jgi:hypothetical protein
MRKLALLLTIGLFLSATAANACDGDKLSAKSHKGKKTCVCTSKTSKTTAMKSSCGKSGCTDPKCSKAAHCTKASADKS